MNEYPGIVINGNARNFTMTGCTVDGVLIPDFDSERPVGSRWLCIPCEVRGDGRDFVREHSVGNHGETPAPSGRRADRRPLSAWLTVWTIARRARIALAGFGAAVRRHWLDVLAPVAGIAVGVAAALLLCWLQAKGIL